MLYIVRIFLQKVIKKEKKIFLLLEFKIMLSLTLLYDLSFYYLIINQFFAVTTFWVSSLTRNYFNSTDPEIALNPDGCLRIRRGSRNSWARNQARASVALCESKLVA